MRSPYLRVKLKSLAAESIIIKREMLKFRTTNPVYERLHLHRVHEVREEARATNVAYGFLNGLGYWEIEASCYQQPNWAKVKNMVTKYGEEGTVEERMERLAEWRKTVQDNRGMHKAVLPVESITEEELVAGLQQLIGNNVN